MLNWQLSVDKMLMILTIVTLLSITESTKVRCTKNISNFTLKLRDEIANNISNSITLNEGINTSGMEELQCACSELQGRRIKLSSYVCAHGIAHS